MLKAPWNSKNLIITIHLLTNYHLYYNIVQVVKFFDCAGVAELADAPDLGSGVSRRGGSSPFARIFCKVKLWL